MTIIFTDQCRSLNARLGCVTLSRPSVRAHATNSLTILKTVTLRDGGSHAGYAISGNASTLLLRGDDAMRHGTRDRDSPIVTQGRHKTYLRTTHRNNTEVSARLSCGVGGGLSRTKKLTHDVIGWGEAGGITRAALSHVHAPKSDRKPTHSHPDSYYLYRALDPSGRRNR